MLWVWRGEWVVVALGRLEEEGQLGVLVSRWEWAGITGPVRP